MQSASVKFGIPFNSWKKYEAGPSEPGSGALKALADGGVNVHWLVTGEGEMLLVDAKPAAIAPAARGLVEESEHFALVPFFDVEASAGRGAYVEDEHMTSQVAFRKDWLKTKGLQLEYLATLKARGDSMEPTLCDGDILLVDRRVDRIIDDSIYIVQTDGHLIVKRLQQSLNGSITVISDNKRYKEQYISSEQAQQIKIAGRVCWYGHEI